MGRAIVRQRDSGTSGGTPTWPPISALGSVLSRTASHPLVNCEGAAVAAIPKRRRTVTSGCAAVVVAAASLAITLSGRAAADNGVDIWVGGAQCGQPTPDSCIPELPR